MKIIKDSNLLNVYRNEWKFYLNKTEYLYLRDILSKIMPLDPNMGDKGEYFIRSLYFDSVDNIDYVTKMMGIERRKKIRFRIYDTNSSKVKMEVKNRYNQYMLKESLSISKADTLSLIEGNYEVLEHYEQNVARKVMNIMKMGGYSPKILVDYEREAFIYPEHNVRITFDKNIRAKVTSDLFNDSLDMVHLIHEPVTVLEVKYNQILPKYIKDVISSADLLQSSISKYCMARELLG